MNWQSCFLKKNKEIRIIIFLFIANTAYLFSQGVGVGTITPHASAKLDVTSTTQGVLISRMTTQQRNAISNPALSRFLIFEV